MSFGRPRQNFEINLNDPEKIIREFENVSSYNETVAQKITNFICLLLQSTFLKSQISSFLKSLKQNENQWFKSCLYELCSEQTLFNKLSFISNLLTQIKEEDRTKFLFMHFSNLSKDAQAEFLSHVGNHINEDLYLFSMNNGKQDVFLKCHCLVLSEKVSGWWIPSMNLVTSDRLVRVSRSRSESVTKTEKAKFQTNHGYIL